MNRKIRKNRQARRAILNLILVAFFVWIILSLVQPVGVEYKPRYADQSTEKTFELVRLERAGHGQELTFYNEGGNFSLQSK